MGRVLDVLRRLAADLTRWGPMSRARRLPEPQQESVLDDHWRNG